MQKICVEFYIKYDLSHLFITLKQFIQKVYIYILHIYIYTTYIYRVKIFYIYYISIYILYYFQCRDLSRQIGILYVESGHCFLPRPYLRSVPNLVISTRVSSGRDFRRDFPTLRTVYSYVNALNTLLKSFKSIIER